VKSYIIGVGVVGNMDEMGGTCCKHDTHFFRDFVEKAEEIIPLERSRHRREDGFHRK
jgi:hypothetical protein